MSKAKNLVRWCLSKAQKELKESGTHRGLVEVRPDAALAKEFLEKAEHNLDAFLLNKKHGMLDWTISMGFYVMYHCCLAIITKFGYETRNQECTFALIESCIEDKKLPEDFKRYLEEMKSHIPEQEDVISMREKYQYTPLIDVEKQKVEALLKLCQDMLKETKGILEV